MCVCVSFLRVSFNFESGRASGWKRLASPLVDAASALHIAHRLTHRAAEQASRV